MRKKSNGDGEAESTNESELDAVLERVREEDPAVLEEKVRVLEGRGYERPAAVLRTLLALSRGEEPAAEDLDTLGMGGLGSGAGDESDGREFTVNGAAGGSRSVSAAEVSAWRRAADRDRLAALGRYVLGVSAPEAAASPASGERGGR